MAAPLGAVDRSTSSKKVGQEGEGQGQGKGRKARQEGPGTDAVQRPARKRQQLRQGQAADRLQGRSAKDRLHQGQASTRTSCHKDKLIAKDKIAQGPAYERQGGERTSSQRTRLGKDKLAKDKIGKDKLAKDKVGKDKLAKDKTGAKTGREGQGSEGPDRQRQGRPRQIQDRQGSGDQDGRGRFAKAKSPVERGKIRVAHRREIITVRGCGCRRAVPRQRPASPACRPPPRRASCRPRWCSMSGRMSRAQSVEAAAARHGMIIVAAQPSGITGGTALHLPGAGRRPDRHRRARDGGGTHRRRIAELRLPHRPGHARPKPQPGLRASGAATNTSSTSCGLPKSTRSRPATTSWSP